jgi:hypothetical protein
MRDFEAGYQRVFVAEDAGPQSAASSALRFSGTTPAESFLDFFRTIHEATSVDPLLGADGLGEEAYGWTRQVPGSETTGFVWRRGDLVLTLTVSARVGDAAPERVLSVARSVDQRLA